MSMPRTHMPETATRSSVRELEAKLVEGLAELEARLIALEIRLGALALGATCHHEWVSPGAGSVAQARRALVVETVVGAGGKTGMTFPEIAAYLHIPRTRHEVLRADIRYLVEADRLIRATRNHAKWRTP